MGYPDRVLAGTAIGSYKIVRQIGQGGMGVVYRGEHTLIGRPAAIKVLLPELSARREIVDRFFNEARATSQVSDPGIVQIFDFGFHSDGSAYIVMELLEGEALNARMRHGQLSLADTLVLARQIAGSLAAAHARGIVHRDLKPHNIFLVPDPEAPGRERAKILDFGIAKLSDDGGDRVRTRTGVLMGTPLYMSPEQCRGSGIVDHRADIYSLGCVLFELVTGRPIFDAEGMGELLSSHLREPPRVPSTLVPGLPPGVDELVLRCLAKAPEQRFQSMLELQAACDGLLDVLLARPSAPWQHGARVSAAALYAQNPTPPPASSTPLYPPVYSATTLSSASAASVITPAPRRSLMWIALGVIAASTIAVVAVIASSGGGKEPAIPAPEPASAVTPPIAPAADAMPASQPPTDAAVVAPPPTPPVDAAGPPPILLDGGHPDARPKSPTGPLHPKNGKSPHPNSGEDLYDDR